MFWIVVNYIQGSYWWKEQGNKSVWSSIVFYVFDTCKLSCRIDDIKIDKRMFAIFGNM